MLVVARLMVGHAAHPRVHVRATELLGRHVRARGRLHERRPAEEDRAGALHDHRFLRHRRHVRPARRGRAHHRGDLRDPVGGHPRLVVEDPTEMLPVGEHVGLQRQERPARVDEVDARQVVVRRDLLGAEVFLHRHGEVGAALHGGVVRDHDARLTVDGTDPSDDARTGGRAVVETLGGERRELEERGTRVDERVDAGVGGELPARLVLRDRFLAAAATHPFEPGPEVVHERLHRRHVVAEGLRAGVDVGGQSGHRSSAGSSGERRAATLPRGARQGSLRRRVERTTHGCAGDSDGRDRARGAATRRARVRRAGDRAAGGRDRRLRRVPPAGVADARRPRCARPDGGSGGRRRRARLPRASRDHGRGLPRLGIGRVVLRRALEPVRPQPLDERHRRATRPVAPRAAVRASTSARSR